MSDDHPSGPPRLQQSWDDSEDVADDGAVIDLDGDSVESYDMGRPGFWERRRLRRLRRRAASRAAVRDYIEQGMPPDDPDAGFDLDTFSGRAGWRIASSWWWKSATAAVLLAVVAGWFILLYASEAVTFAALSGLVLVPAVMLWLLGRQPGREPDA